MSEAEPISKLNERIENESLFSEEQKGEFKNLVSEYYYRLGYGCESVKLDSITIRDFNNIRYADFRPHGSSKIIHAQNSEGKTSLLKAIQFNLLGLPEDGNARSHYGMTDLIRKGGELVDTQANWLVDGEEVPLQRNLVAKGRGGKLKQYNKPTLGKDDGDIPQDRHNQPSEVFERFGLLPLINRGFDAYEIMSLFFLMSRDFLSFLNSPNSAEIIDLMFGIYLTNVSKAVGRKRDSDVEITDAMARAPMKVEEIDSNLSAKKKELENLQSQREALRDRIAAKQESLDSLKGAKNAEEVLDNLRSRRSSLRSELADLKMEMSETSSELAKAERLLERYDDTELVEDIGGIGEELEALMTVPDRCPICTNQVDGEKKKKMLDNAECALCSKTVPKERLNVEREYQASDSIITQREEEQQEREELEEKINGLESNKARLKREVDSIREEIDDIEQEISEHDLTDTLKEKEELEKEIRSLRQDAVELEVKMDRMSGEISELEFDKKGNKHLRELLNERREEKSDLERLQGIILSVRDEERARLKNELEDEMSVMLESFTTGIFSGAEEVAFEQGDTYHFRVFSTERTFRSSQAEPEAAEASLHALLFHASVLKRLSELEGSLPIRSLIIDSPFANEMSQSNRVDVSQVLSELPDYLEDYQIIIAMADPDYGEPSVLENSPLQIEEFEARVDSPDSGSEETTQLTAEEAEERDHGIA